MLCSDGVRLGAAARFLPSLARRHLVELAQVSERDGIGWRHRIHRGRYSQSEVRELIFFHQRIRYNPSDSLRSQ